jgi:geranylgeranyl reductase family protein
MTTQAAGSRGAQSSVLSPQSFDFEAIVVGGGPGGSTTAALLAEAGHRVMLLDKASFPRHKACSEYVNPAGVRLLRELGIESELEERDAHRMEAMLIHAPGGGHFLADFAGAEPGRTALGLSRYRLDHLLLQRAEAAGVTVCQRAHVRDLLIEGGRVGGVVVTIDGRRETLRAPLVIGADGRHSVVSRALRLDAPVRWPRRTGLVAHYRGVTGLDRWGEMHVARHGYAGLALLEDGLTNVAFVADAVAVTGREGTLEHFFADGLARIPEVASKLAGAERVGEIRGVGPMARRARQTAGDGFLLVGDAASFLDPFTGEGIYEALRAARLAAPVASAALRAGDTSATALAPYRAARRRAFTAKRQVCWLIQAFIHTPTLMDYAAERLDRRPATAQTLTGVLGDFRPAHQALSPLFLARLLRP